MVGTGTLWGHLPGSQPSGDRDLRLLSSINHMSLARMEGGAGGGGPPKQGRDVFLLGLMPASGCQ